MEGSRTEYPAMLDSLEPAQAVTVLNDRVKQVGKINVDIADWLMERRRIEEIYVQGLRRLAQRQLTEDSADLGVFTTPWQKITTAAASLADSHHQLAVRLEKEVEKPLRTYAGSNREMQNMTTMQGNLLSLAKDYDGAQKKADKLNQKGGKADSSKVATASSDFENASSQWTSQAPYVFETLQAVDEARCNHLRDVLTQFETFEVDCIERDRKTAESTLNSLLNVETAQEIKTFASRKAGTTASRVTTATTERRTSKATPSRPQVPVVAEPLPVPSPSVEEKKSRLSGFKRFGTVVGRRRQSTQPTLGERTNSGAGVSSTSLSVTQSNGERPGTQRNQSSSTLGDVAPPPGPPPSASRSHGIESVVTPGYVPSKSSTLGVVDEQTPTASYTNGSPHTKRLSSLPSALQPTSQSQYRQSQLLARDSEGFAIPPPPSSNPITQAELEGSSIPDSSNSQPKVLLRDAPITEDPEQADSAMANLASKLREQAVQPKRTTTQRGRRDVRNTVFLPQGSIIPSPPADEPKNELEASPSAVATSSSPGFSSAAFVSSLQSGSSPLQSFPSPFSASTSSVPGRMSVSEETASDSQSIRSARSANAAGPIKHPELQTPGLSSSVVETVSAWLENGSVTRAVVIGEMALAHNSNPLSPNTSSTDTIRLDNFAALEKVAPNPSFIAQISADRPGEYSIDLGSIPRTTVAFKYQVHLDSATFATQTPLIFTPTWKVEPTMSSVILSYSASPSISSPISLSNVVIAIHIEGRAASCLSKPTGAFSKERALVYWRIESLTVTPGAAPQKLLARFNTLEEAKPGRIEAKWEIASTDGTLGIGSGLGVSRLEGAGTDPFADQDESTATWAAVGCTRRIVSGTYVAV